MNRNDLLDLIPAYALDALDPDERAELDALLASDIEAQTLLAEYEAISETLLFNVQVRSAPSYLREDLQSRLSTQRETTEQKQATTRTISFPISLSMAAAVFVMVIGLMIFLPQSSQPQNPNELLFNQLLDAEGTSHFSIVPDTAENVSGELLISADHNSAVIRIASLPDTTSDESYQLWLITDDAVHNGGIFHWATGHGPYYVSILPEAIDSLQAVGMTIEPFEGSPLGNAPTGDRLFAVSVAVAN